MAVNISLLASIKSASVPASSGSLTWTAGGRGIVFIAAANTDPGDITSVSVSGGGVNWASVASIQAYGARRGVDIYMSDATPADGVISVSAVTTNTFNEIMASVCEVTGQAAVPVAVGNFKTNSVSPGPIALNVASIGVIGAGGLVLWAGGFENGADGLTLEQGTQVDLINAGSDVRSLIVGKSTIDDTPGIKWTSNTYYAGIAGVIIDAAAVASGGSGTFSDAKYGKLVNILGYNGQVNDMEVTWLQTLDVSIVSNEISEAWMQYWDFLTIAAGSFDDRAYAWLGGLGHTGSLQDRWWKFWLT